MEMKAVFIKAIYQKDCYQFTIEWTDGKIFDYLLSEIQRHCACVRCIDQKVALKSSCDDVEAARIVSVGDYALQIYFTKGCSKGIYSFELLRKIGSKHEV
jgi:DUF971 family protein